jgi:HEPN domain-containing protein
MSGSQAPLASIDGVNRKDLQSLARTRLAEAKALFEAGFPDGAYYVAGYAVECALKACIAKATRRYDFPDKKKVDDSHTHNLKVLTKLANLDLARLEQANRDPIFRNNWDVVEQWSEHSRYRSHSSEMARALVEAISDRKHGVIAWIERHW